MARRNLIHLSAKGSAGVTNRFEEIVLVVIYDACGSTSAVHVLETNLTVYAANMEDNEEGAEHSRISAEESKKKDGTTIPSSRETLLF